MKRLFISFLLLTVMLCGAMAQPIYVYRKDGPKETFQRSNVESIRYSKEDMDGVTHPNYVVQEFCTSEGITRIPLSAIDSVVYMPYSPSYLTCPDDHHPHAIDLGLPSGTKWACCNVGATAPEEYGGYYAWGETSEKDYYDEDNYAYYNSSSKNWISIGDDIAGTSYDVAHVQWDGSWVMPSLDRQMELINNCNREWSTVNGVSGTLVTGPNGGQIFLPAAGNRWLGDLNGAGFCGYYWSSTQDPDYYSGFACGLDFDSGDWVCSCLSRDDGASVRAVCPGSPVAEHPEAHPSITDFKVTASAYAADGFTYEGQTYDYKFDVSVSAEIDNLEGVEDWGYVCQVTDGGIIRVSLMEYGQSYTDTRYAYYRNEAHSTATLYAYVKYVGDSQYYDGELQEYSLDYTAPTSYLTCPDDHHPHVIDLGLPSGTKWACCNIGASSPEGYGGYYAWGETSEKSDYDWDTYAYYNSQTGKCISLGSDIAGTSYDVAHVQWGGSWVMPSADRQMELINNCNREWSTVNGVNGTLVTGPSGGQIFLPAAGCRWDGGLGAGSYGDYWSSTQYPGYSNRAYRLCFGSAGYCYWGGDDRYFGQPVRAVCPGSPVAEHPEAHSSITDFNVTASAYAADGFTYEGKTYNYKFDVSVSAEIDNLEGVEDWGYVYQTPDGSITRVSLMEYGQSYTDTRYAYYRNEAHSAVSLYAYVKYVGDSQYHDGTPQDYPLDYTAPTVHFSCPDAHHPHAIDLGLPSGTKWACCNVGADAPEEYGGYYAWGETSEKDSYLSLIHI